jgi:Asp-tRNA(Asn)/Glu-tRNA(Gln) amidotransferase A subunit family amidase
VLNPYHLMRASGGSSCGTGVALVPTGDSGLGSDIGESTRSRASINGLVV